MKLFELKQNSVSFDGRNILVELSPQSPASLYTLTLLNVDKIDKAFQKEKDFYIGPNGSDGIRGRYERFGKFIEDAESVEAAIIDISETGKIDFVNGRHRFAYFRDNGVKQLPIALSKESLKNARANSYLA